MRTNYLLALPVNLKLRDIPSARGVSLPTGVMVNGFNQVNGVSSATMKNPFGTAIACLDQVLSGQQVTQRSFRLEGVQRRRVLLNRLDGLDLSAEMRQLDMAGFGHMDFIADPVKVSFFSVTCLLVIGPT